RYRVQLMADQIRELFGHTPETLEEFALASQISQAEAKKFFVEMTRLRKWRRTGVLWWNVIDCWPQFSDAVVDYFFAKKLAYFYLKRVQYPVCLMVDEPEAWHVRVVAGNDSRQPAEGDFRVWDADTGQTLLAGEFHTAANTNSELGRIRVSHGEQRLFLMQWETGGRTYGNHYLLGKPPVSLPRYRAWLPHIAALPDGFAAEDVAR
ncbi:MAG: glycoside hydrolase family 2, partial [Armatimonadota bacterium]|nr:glycoside hydrolase family 2 [Armatimonadota bacterium]